MIKKMILTGGALALLSSVTLGVPLFSYARCGVSWLKQFGQRLQCRSSGNSNGLGR